MTSVASQCFRSSTVARKVQRRNVCILEPNRAGQIHASLRAASTPSPPLSSVKSIQPSLKDTQDKLFRYTTSDWHLYIVYSGEVSAYIYVIEWRTTTEAYLDSRALNSRR
ncbi:hypothetical protein BD324DRAFT_348904 [Kockovaella imperatae]|uniref:Uncharacterized protein n=1 Tax=Kockovaella imperatae TaxID=4999 RepID=A0A1Y1UL83_9TREE|nr:hypothetical protein BD324DRAFT_348904 [Kockovaella imperatae]ORX38317.1 hypothetical protein BD324DRAFT_348904 [Kockovaella imperatae]